MSGRILKLGSINRIGLAIRRVSRSSTSTSSSNVWNGLGPLLCSLARLSLCKDLTAS